MSDGYRADKCQIRSGAKSNGVEGKCGHRPTWANDHYVIQPYE